MGLWTIVAKHDSMRSRCAKAVAYAQQHALSKALRCLQPGGVRALTDDIKAALLGKNTQNKVSHVEAFDLPPHGLRFPPYLGHLPFRIEEICHAVRNANLTSVAGAKGLTFNLLLELLQCDSTDDDITSAKLLALAPLRTAHSVEETWPQRWGPTDCCL